MNWLKKCIVKWANPRIYGRWPKFKVEEPFAGSNSSTLEVPLPDWRSNPPKSIPYPKCWCGHYARSHTKDGCQVFDCPCEKLMDASAVICTKCLQVHPSEDPCMPPGAVTYVDNNWTPKVVGGISQGVLVNFKPAKGKEHERS